MKLKILWKYKWPCMQESRIFEKYKMATLVSGSGKFIERTIWQLLWAKPMNKIWRNLRTKVKTSMFRWFFEYDILNDNIVIIKNALTSQCVAEITFEITYCVRLRCLYCITFATDIHACDTYVFVRTCVRNIHKIMEICENLWKSVEIRGNPARRTNAFIMCNT